VLPVLLELGETFSTKPLAEVLALVLPLVPVAPADEPIVSRCRQPVTVM
jgi:hypothetical protein